MKHFPENDPQYFLSFQHHEKHDIDLTYAKGTRQFTMKSAINFLIDLGIEVFVVGAGYDHYRIGVGAGHLRKIGFYETEFYKKLLESEENATT